MNTTLSKSLLNVHFPTVNTNQTNKWKLTGINMTTKQKASLFIDRVHMVQHYPVFKSGIFSLLLKYIVYQVYCCRLSSAWTVNQYWSTCVVFRRKRGLPAGGSQGSPGRRQPAASAAPHRRLPGERQQRWVPALCSCILEMSRGWRERTPLVFSANPLHDVKMQVTEADCWAFFQFV